MISGNRSTLGYYKPVSNVENPAKVRHCYETEHYSGLISAVPSKPSSKSRTMLKNISKPYNTASCSNIIINVTQLHLNTHV